MKDISIVVASRNTRRTIGLCLQALSEQAHDDKIEILVLDASTDGSAEIARQYQRINVVRADPACLVPELWKQGIELTSGQSVAFTTANFIPAGNWVKELMLLLQSDHAAIGGVFEKQQPDELSQWAIYFLRYAAYQPALAPQSATQLAADNAVYRRWVFEKYPHLLVDGFWEHEVNRRLKADGHSLFLAPSLRVSIGYFSTPADFFQQRFLHGRAFGAERAAHTSMPKRMFYIFASPLIPLILLARVTMNVLKYSPHRFKFFLSVPWLIFYAVGWAFGELSGYLAGKHSQ